jgi:3-oxoacyl-[acyl-carrier protein] reductase
MADPLVLITGTTGEIGSYLTDRFLNNGWTVCGLDQKAPPNVDRPNFLFQECDLSDGEAAEKKIEIFHEQFGAFDAVINCAGLIANAPLISFVSGQLTRHDFELWNRVLSSCLSSAFYVSACTVLKMVAAGKKGVIINISSICSRGNRGQVAYSAAKAGLHGLTRSLAKELGPAGIRVVALAPGYFDTASTRNNVSDSRLREVTNAVPLKRLGNIEEVAKAIEFILDNGYVNGTVVELDGGLVI